MSTCSTCPIPAYTCIRVDHRTSITGSLSRLSDPGGQEDQGPRRIHEDGVRNEGVQLGTLTVQGLPVSLGLSRSLSGRQCQRNEQSSLPPTFLSRFRLSRTLAGHEQPAPFTWECTSQHLNTGTLSPVMAKMTTPMTMDIFSPALQDVDDLMLTPFPLRSSPRLSSLHSALRPCVQASHSLNFHHDKVNLFSREHFLGRDKTALKVHSNMLGVLKETCLHTKHFQCYFEHS